MDKMPYFVHPSSVCGRGFTSFTAVLLDVKSLILLEYIGEGYRSHVRFSSYVSFSHINIMYNFDLGHPYL